jgi:phosphoenolpyruvate-protein phosphotransferase
MKQGVPVSPGVVVARAFVVELGALPRGPYHLDAAALSGEVSRFERACADAARELDAVADRVARQVGEPEADIFRAHRLLLRDPTLLGKVKAHIAERQVDAATALKAVLDEYAPQIQQMPDPTLRERAADLRDVVGRVQAHLAVQNGRKGEGLHEPVILAATEILPSQALTFDRRLVAGIVTERGSTTGHAAILARALGIPAVAGVRGLMRELRSGDLIALDAREGHVYLNPGPEVESAYRKLQREYADLYVKLAANRDAESVTPCGQQLELLANVNGTADAVAARDVGACGVGLYRTEYVFLTHPSVPDEEEQYAAYRAVVEASPNRTVTIRTLDLGGDKQVAYLGRLHEANPFMGWRSVRLASAYPEFFQTQLRAILRAAAHGKVSLMFPMISAYEEVLRLKRMLGRARESLRRDGVAVPDDVPVGIMVEVPAAALCVDKLLEEVDFLSIGSNDLVQYLMAADRDNPRVAHLCEPFNAALLRLIEQVVKAANARGKPVTICGEMAGWPRCFIPLFGMGLRRFSMTPAALPSLKEVVRHTPLETARRVARRVLKMHTAGEIRSYLTHMVREVWPEVALVDMRK